MNPILQTFAFFLKGLISIVECSEEHLAEFDPEAHFELSVGEPLETHDFKKQAAVLKIELEFIAPIDWSQCVLNSF